MEKTKVVFVLLLTALVLFFTAHVTYRTTMRNISVEIDGRYAYLTVYGQTDRYMIDR